MDLREGEEVLKVYRHHPTPFVFKVIKFVIGFLPFYIVLWALESKFSIVEALIANVIFFAIFGIVITYVSLTYWLDKFVLTNQRVIFIDYKYLTYSVQAYADLLDIQDVSTQEKGLLAYFKIFDYGTFSVDTASSSTIIDFPNAPDPEGIRRDIYRVKPQ